MECAEPDSGDDAEESRVYYAVTTDDVYLIKLLIKDGLSPNYTFKGENQLDKTLLHLACEQGRYDSARCLLEAGARPRDVDAWCQTPLTYSVCTDRDNLVDLLLEAKWRPLSYINHRDNFGKTAFQYASTNHSFKRMQLLLAAGADINSRDRTGHTALSNALREDGNVQVVEYLIKNGADVNQIDRRQKRSPLQVAILEAKNDVYDYSKLLVDSGATVNTIDALGHSPMASVMRRNRQDGPMVQDIDLKLAELLLRDDQFEVNLISHAHRWYRFKGTALKMAVERGAVPFLQLLLEHGADTEICDVDGFTPLFLAVKDNKVDIVRVLLSFNCRMDAVSTVSCEDKQVPLTVLRYAIMMRRWEVAEVLVMAGYDLSREEYLSTNEDVPDTLLTNFDFWSWLVQTRFNPKCLRFQCRDLIRAVLRGDVGRVNKLPLPQRLKDMLMFRVNA